MAGDDFCGWALAMGKEFLEVIIVRVAARSKVFIW
jgi:hypothetical protein